MAITVMTVTFMQAVIGSPSATVIRWCWGIGIEVVGMMTLYLTDEKNNIL